MAKETKQEQAEFINGIADAVEKSNTENIIAEPTGGVGFGDEDLGTQRRPITPNKDTVGVECTCAAINFETGISKKTEEPYEAISFVFEKELPNEGAAPTILQSTIKFFAPIYIEDALEDKEIKLVTRRLAQIKHMFGAFTKGAITAERLRGLRWVKGTPFSDVFNSFNNLVEEDYKTLKLKVKFVYNGKNTAVPLFPAFISSKYKVEKLVATSYDKFELEVLAPQEESGY